MLRRMLKLASVGVPMVDDAVACDTEQGLLRVLLSELVVHLRVLVEVWPELDAPRRRRIAALLGNLALSLIFEQRSLEKANCAISVAWINEKQMSFRLLRNKLC